LFCSVSGFEVFRPFLGNLPMHTDSYMLGAF
jgi:hypothetical protein